ncbi:MAG: helicase-related protein, partial [Actinomycetota bacterium]
GSTDISEVGSVVIDEVHFLQDAYRGPVWEEVLIHLPAAVQLACLSATVSNAAELAEWIESLKGATTAIVEQRRPVELIQHYLLAERGRGEPTMLPLFVDGSANRYGPEFDAPERRHEQYRRGGRRVFTPRRGDTVALLASRRMLPAIYFIFSRAQCDEAAETCHGLGISLTNGDERRRIDAHVAEHLGGLDDDERRALDVDGFVERLRHGIGSHHAGMIPAMKETVEACFVDGLVKVVFATETLAVGINMPARTVVIEKLTKYNGETHEQLTAAEFTQLTGRAGRRGIDDIGHAVVCWSPWVRFDDVVGLASSRSFRLRSAFRSTYNMAANLVAQHDRAGARDLLNRSFAQFQADRDIVRLAAKLERRGHRRDAARRESQSDYGDIDGYRAERVAKKAASDARRAELRHELGRLRPGTVVAIEGGPDHGPAVVIANADRRSGRRLRLVGASGAVVELDERSLTALPDVVGAIELPSPYAPNRRSFHRAVRDALNEHSFDRPVVPRASRAATRHPVEDDPDLRHKLERAAVADGLDREIDAIRRRMDRAEHSIAQEFDHVIGVLSELQLVDHDAWRLTSDGQRVTRVFHENDLLAVLALRAGVFDGLAPADVAALTSLLVYEHRSAEPAAPPWFSSKQVGARADLLSRCSAELTAVERRHRVTEHRPPDPGFAAIAHGWVVGEHLTEILDEEDLSGGDLVRTMKQLIDLLRQLASIAPDTDTAAAFDEAAVAAWRGVVADGGVGG